MSKKLTEISNGEIQPIITGMIEKLREQVGEQKVVMGMSGGVDSTVTAALLSRAIGKQLTCVLVDHGFMRKNEISEVVEVFEKNFDANLVSIDASEQFLQAVAGVSDPEQKRKIIGAQFIKVFEQVAKEIGAVDLLAQGTIYPDVVESGVGGARTVKSHHNVGGLPEAMEFKGLVEPLRELYKDEVRVLGAALGLPEEIVWRQPFPGPGLAIRVIGEITKEKLDILRDADAILRAEIFAAGLHRDINQYFAILTDSKAVGARGDLRNYDYVLALRAVETNDFMTAGWARIPYEILEKISRRIVDEVERINRVVYDITTKPPAKIEWE